MATKKAKRVVKKAVQKKVVKKKVAVQAPRIENIDLIQYFKTGLRDNNEAIFIVGNTLNCTTNHPKVGDYVTAAIKSNGYTVINGDKIIDKFGYIDEVVDNLQDYGSDEITTSFKCLTNAGIDLTKIKVLEITKDVDVCSKIGSEDFDDFEKNMPSGASLTQYTDEDYDLDEDDDGYSEEDAERITEKRYHRAGCMLIKEGKFSYICGMDEDSYFVTKLSKNPTTIDKAFHSLKPKAVVAWEKKSGKIARRQGEWFFLPTDLTKVKGMRRKGLPLWKDGGNKHMASKYVVQDGKNYVKGHVSHNDHGTEILGDTIHEAIMNTQLGSWSEQGVD